MPNVNPARIGQLVPNRITGFLDRLEGNVRRHVIPAAKKATPVRTGKLQRSWKVRRTATGIEITVDWYFLVVYRGGLARSLVPQLRRLIAREIRRSGI